jgi:hypothetical protein
MKSAYAKLYQACGSVAQWITRPATNREIAGSIPARLDFFIESYPYMQRCSFFYFFVMNTAQLICDSN